MDQATVAVAVAVEAAAVEAAADVEDEQLAKD